jgi:hypothetical protein
MSAPFSAKRIVYPSTICDGAVESRTHVAQGLVAIVSPAFMHSAHSAVALRSEEAVRVRAINSAIVIVVKTVEAYLTSKGHRLAQGVLIFPHAVVCSS